MKKIILTIAISTVSLFAADYASAQDNMQDPAQNNRLKVKISGIREAKGTIMVALGDYADPAKMAVAMVPANEGTVECVLTGNIDLDARLHVFHDENGNFNLDMNEMGVPTEGCASVPVETDENGTALVKLTYHAATL